jgi:hypothetical protein
MEDLHAIPTEDLHAISSDHSGAERVTNYVWALGISRLQGLGN